MKKKFSYKIIIKYKKTVKKIKMIFSNLVSIKNNNKIYFQIKKIYLILNKKRKKIQTNKKIYLVINFKFLVTI